VLHTPILCESKSVSTDAVKAPPPPDGLWVTLAAFGGILVGILIPLPLAPFLSPARRKGNRDWRLLVALAFGAFISLVVAAHDDLEEPFVWCALGGVLLGLLIPSPARGD
jgi:hypothetical protein